MISLRRGTDALASVIKNTLGDLSPLGNILPMRWGCPAPFQGVAFQVNDMDLDTCQRVDVHESRSQAPLCKQRNWMGTGVFLSVCA